MKPITRKRLISTCIPCYVKKQKCDRKYPCDHCTKRRRPDECVYHAYPNAQSSTSKLSTQQSNVVNVAGHIEDHMSSVSTLGQPDVSLDFPGRDCLSLTKRYGYLESSDSNALELVRKFGGEEIEHHDSSTQVLIGNDANEVKGLIERMPTRPILDFLIQFFVFDVAWIDQVIYPPWFLGRYHHWQGKDSEQTVADVEFLVLVLRVCSYALQFLPSPYHALNRISGVSLININKSCEEVASCLAAIVCRLDRRGCWIRVQHTTLLALKFQTEGKMEDCWAALNIAINTALNDGMDRDKPSPGRRLNELHKEMRRRTYCHLYIWDSQLSRLLDHVPLLPDAASDRTWTQMRLVYIKEGSSDGDAGAEEDLLDGYMHGILQARMATFWRRFDARHDANYDMVMAGERYQQFCNEFLPTIPSPFSLHPNTMWDKRRPKLPLLRQLLHIAIFDSLCWNFRPLLFFEEPYDTNNLPPYKRLLLSCQKRALAVAALQVLDAVGNLHQMLGRSHTRFVGIIIPTFEAAIPLVCLCMDPQFPEDDGRTDNEPSVQEVSQSDPLRTRLMNVTREACIKAVQDALRRLKMLAKVSSVAEVGAQALGRLFEKMAAASTEDVSMNQQKGAAVETPLHHHLREMDNIQIRSWPHNEPLDHIPMDMLGTGAILEPQGNYYEHVETFMSGSSMEYRP